MGSFNHALSTTQQTSQVLRDQKLSQQLGNIRYHSITPTVQEHVNLQAKGWKCTGHPFVVFAAPRVTGRSLFPRKTLRDQQSQGLFRTRLINRLLNNEAEKIGFMVCIHIYLYTYIYICMYVCSQLIGNGPTCEFLGVLTLILWRPRQFLDETLKAATPNPKRPRLFCYGSKRSRHVPPALGRIACAHTELSKMTRQSG